MNDISTLFEELAPGVGGAPSAATIEADLARGRLALAHDHRRRTIRRSMVAGGTLVVGAAVAVAATQFSAGSSPHPSTAGGPLRPSAGQGGHASATPTTGRPNRQHSATVKLVDYKGHQLKGFTVDRVPRGWHLSAVSAYALTIDSATDTNNDPDVFEGKLTVLLQSKDAHGLGPGDPVTVNGHAGVVDHHAGGGGENLTYTDGHGHTIVVQAPHALGWGDDDIVAFARGVHVTAEALAGVG
jgi:hypothetical protein